MILHRLEALGEQVREYAPDYIGLSIRNIDNTDTINSRGFLVRLSGSGAA